MIFLRHSVVLRHGVHTDEHARWSATLVFASVIAVTNNATSGWPGPATYTGRCWSPARLSPAVPLLCTQVDVLFRHPCRIPPKTFQASCLLKQSSNLLGMDAEALSNAAFPPNSQSFEGGHPERAPILFPSKSFTEPHKDSFPRAPGTQPRSPPASRAALVLVVTSSCTGEKGSSLRSASLLRTSACPAPSDWLIAAVTRAGDGKPRGELTCNVLRRNPKGEARTGPSSSR